MTTAFVLVHGAWHRPSTFDLLRVELDALGHASVSVNLPTAGPDPQGGLAEDAAAVRAAIEAIEGPVVVLAHSYGGIPVTQAAAGLSNVQQLIYLAAYVPDIGESMFTIHGVPDPEDSDALFPIGDDPHSLLYADVPSPLAEQAVADLVEQRVQPWVDRVTAAAWRTIPSTYIITERDATLPVALQERMSAHTKQVRRIATSHSPFLFQPAEFAAVLDELSSR
ncbi:alpha/beta hydrolase [Streptomyces sp. NPDC051940]|uniref:alpha/beta hydrolase n=1 Tax=Streptomyces sp. NPDC051940 TaxID=3155675 RepID=UPI003421292B